MKPCSFVLGLVLLLCATQAQAATLNKVAAVVNGQMISAFDVMAAAKPEMLKNKINPDNPAQQRQADKILRAVLDGMIMDILIEQEAERMKVTVANNEVDEEIARVMKQSQLPKNQFEQQLKREGLSVDVLRDRVRKTILRQKLMGMMVGRKVVVTPEEIAAYYEEHKHEMRANSTLRMALLIYPPNVNARDYAAKIKNGAVSFEDVVRKFSIGPNREGGGDVGPVAINKLNPEWRTRLSRMSPGDVSEIFRIEGKSAQVKLLRGPEGGELQDLAAATPTIEKILREPRLQERFVEYVDQLRKKAMIDIRM